MNKYIRQKNLVDKEIFKNNITVIGVGGIGSFLTLTLAKMGFKNITIYDDDKIEEYNLPNQFYKIENINNKKVFALHDLIRKFENDCKIYPIAKRWLSTDKTTGIIISAVDNMQTREALFNYSIENPKTVPLFLDGRMGRLQAEIYTVNTNSKKDINIYTNRLWKSSETEKIPCTEKTIIYNVLFISSMICSQLKLALENKIYQPCIIMDLENTRLSLLK